MSKSPGSECQTDRQVCDFALAVASLFVDFMAENNPVALLGDEEEEEVQSMTIDHNWRAHLTKASRQEIVSKITNCLKKNLPISGPEALTEIKKLAARHEEKIYTSSASQADYMRKIHLKIFDMEIRPEIPFGAPWN